MIQLYKIKQQCYLERYAWAVKAQINEYSKRKNMTITRSRQ